MKQGSFAWLSEAPAPREVSAATVLSCHSEAQAVRHSLAIAYKLYGFTQAQVSELCGWQSPSFLSEIAKESNTKQMPLERVARFMVATGCRLVEQYHDKIAEAHRDSGKRTEREESEAVAAACIASWRVAA